MLCFVEKIWFKLLRFWAFQKVLCNHQTCTSAIWQAPIQGEGCGVRRKTSLVAECLNAKNSKEIWVRSTVTLPRDLHSIKINKTNAYNRLHLTFVLALPLIAIVHLHLQRILPFHHPQGIQNAVYAHRQNAMSYSAVSQPYGSSARALGYLSGTHLYTRSYYALGSEH